MKGFILGLLVLLLLAVPAAMQAQYSISTNADGVSCTITGYSGPGGAVNIPSAINDLSVNNIGSNAFISQTSLTSVTIPGNVTNIASKAFYFCDSLTNVIIPGSVTSIGTGAFRVCNNLIGVWFTGNAPSLSSNVFVGDTDATVYYFQYTTGWSSTFGGLPTALFLYSFTTENGTITITGYSGPSGAVTIPSSIGGLPVTSIGGYAFDEDDGNTSPTIIIIPDTVSILQNAAFQQAYVLATISIGSGVTNIGSQDVFLVCFALTNITVDALNPNYCSVNGVLFNKEKTVLLQYPIGASGENYTIPTSVTGIGESSFDYAGDTLYGGGNLRRVVVPSGVTNIADGSMGYGGAFGYSGVSAVFFTGNAPTVDSTAFVGDSVTCYYLPGTTGWSNFAAAANVQVALWNPLIQSGGSGFGVISNQFRFNITGTTNIPIVIEVCTNLADPGWTPLQAATLTNGSFYFSDPQWTNFPVRFYGIGFF